MSELPVSSRLDSSFPPPQAANTNANINTDNTNSSAICTPIFEAQVTVFPLTLSTLPRTSTYTSTVIVIFNVCWQQTPSSQRPCFAIVWVRAGSSKVKREHDFVPRSTPLQRMVISIQSAGGLGRIFQRAHRVTSQWAFYSCRCRSAQ